MVRPLQLEVLDVGPVDLRERAVAMARVAARVGEPVLRLTVGVEQTVGRHLRRRATRTPTALSRIGRRKFMADTFHRSGSRQRLWRIASLGSSIMQRTSKSADVRRCAAPQCGSPCRPGGRPPSRPKGTAGEPRRKPWRRRATSRAARRWSSRAAASTAIASTTGVRMSGRICPTLAAGGRPSACSGRSWPPTRKWFPRTGASASSPRGASP